LLAAVARGLEVSPDSLPAIERGRRPPRDPEFDALVERLKVARNTAALRLDLATGVLCPNATLEGIARIRAQSAEALLTVPGIRRWQVEVLGEEFLTVVRATAAGPDR
jgi:ribonuclease D